MPEARTPLHKQPKICAHILSSCKNSSVPLKIAASSIANAGSGLFVAADVAAGSDIFRSEPLLMVCEGNSSGICDYCFTNSNSSVHPDGRFYGAKEEAAKVALAACVRCQSVQYCSKKCQARAWKSYHKYECSIIQEIFEYNKKMGAVPHALARLLVWIKKQVLSKEDFGAIVSMEHHYEERADRWLEVIAKEDAVLEPTLRTAYTVQQTTDSKLGLNQIQKLLQIILHNAGSICPPEMVDQYGTFLDLVVSTINHSCDNNAHIFFIGRELRCRAIKDIPAGTEITVHYYPAPRHDVLLRRNTLDEYMYINCNCERCKKELAEHLLEAPHREDHLHKVKDAQRKLDMLGLDAQKAFTQSSVLKCCLRFQDQISAIVLKGYPGGRWPEHMEPLPHIYRLLGGMYRDLKFAIGLEFILKGTLYVRDKTDPNWVADLWSLTKFMLFMAQAGENDMNWLAAEDKSLIKREDMRTVARGYLSILCLRAKFTFGMDADFVRALYHWTDQFLECGGEPKLKDESFRVWFEESQKKILNWANMSPDHALPLPSRDKLLTLQEDIQTHINAEKLSSALGAVELRDKTNSALPNAVTGADDTNIG